VLNTTPRLIPIARPKNPTARHSSTFTMGSSNGRTLNSAFGGGDELGYAEFAPGSAMLTAESKSKRDTLTKVLMDRPALKLDIIGFTQSLPVPEMKQ
jgi:hypothetical protein